MFENIKNDFPMFKNVKEMQGNRFVYLDNAATTFKPYSVIEAGDSYCNFYNANSHRGDYDIANAVDRTVAETRKRCADFINADEREIVFTSGASMSINTIAYGFASKILKNNDEILVTEAEHASNLLPFIRFADYGVILNYIDLDEEGRLTPENVEKAITPRTKMICIAHVTNVLGYVADIKKICEIAHKHGIIVSVDGAQSVPHMKIDVKDLDCDFLSFSCHKMCGPTGLGILYGKYKYLEQMDPLMTGGGMNVKFGLCGEVKYLDPPEKFEAGTLNLEGIFAFNETLKYLSKIGMENIEKRERELRKYAISRMKENPNIIIYNENAESGIISFNYKGVFAQDEATYLNSKGICVRSGQHCAKLLDDFLETPATIRASIYFYNDESDIDALVDALKTGGDFLDAYFN